MNNVKTHVSPETISVTGRAKHLKKFVFNTIKLSRPLQFFLMSSIPLQSTLKLCNYSRSRRTRLTFFIEGGMLCKVFEHTHTAAQTDICFSSNGTFPACHKILLRFQHCVRSSARACGFTSISAAKTFTGVICQSLHGVCHWQSIK